jgi:hypothetical protein
MKNLTTLALVVILALAATGCKKKGQFSTDKETYKQGDIITVTNETKKSAKYYSWSLGGTSVEGENPVFTIPESTPVGSFEISILPKNSKNTTGSWKENSNTVMIEAAEKAEIIFHLPSPRTGSSSETFTVTIDNVDHSGSVYSYTPTCGESNPYAATFDNMAAGEYYYTIYGSGSGSYNLSGYVTLDDGFDCQRINVKNL